MATSVDAPLSDSRQSSLKVNVEHFLLNGKSRRWMLCEWFYSDVDRCLLTTDNEFDNCLAHFFPELLNRQPGSFTRQQWTLIRRRFGKPRRLSRAYLDSERTKLARQRNLLRIVQYESKTHHPSEKHFLNNLPSIVIPPLAANARVVVRLARSSQFGLYRGRFIARDEAKPHEYQIVFDDPIIGRLNVNDFDVMSEESLERVGLAEKLKTIQFGDKDKKFYHSDEDGEEEEDAPTTDEEESTAKANAATKIPDRLLYLIIRVSRILCAKRDAVDNLRKMNDQAEFEISRHIPLSDTFRREYAHLIQWLAKLNEHLARFIEEINSICRNIVTDEQLLVVFNDPQFVCDRSQRLAKDLVSRLNIAGMVLNENTLTLITKLVALVVQMKEFSESEGTFLELHALDEANDNFKKFIPPSLLATYRQCVESSVTQFKSGLNNRPALGFLQSFLHTQSNLNEQQSKNSSMNQTFFSV